MRTSRDYLARKCHETRSRMSRDCRTNENEAAFVGIRKTLTNVLGLSYDSRATIVRATVARYVSKIRPKFANLSRKCPFNETAT